MTDQFIGRQAEIRTFKNLLKKKSASLAVIKGRRRIGKSRLISEFCKGHRTLNFMGLPPDESTTALTQRKEFVRVLAEHMGISKDTITSDDWSDLFNLLASQTNQGRLIIVLDEISWMGSKDKTFLGKLKTLWDQKFKLNPELILILCGSVSSWIEDNILANTGFYGRISWTLNLQELPLHDCHQFINERGFHGSAQEEINLLSVTGGIPWYLEQIQQNDTVSSFTNKQCFTQGGVLVKDFDRIFSDLFKQRNKIYQRIVKTLVGGALDFDQIRLKLGYKKSGRLSTYLSHLIDAGFISRHFSWNFKTGENLSSSQYRLSDNYVRFYLKYIAPKQAQIQSNNISSVQTVKLPNWHSIMGLQFENLVLKNRQLILQELNIDPNDIVNDSPYFQTTTKNRQGCQIDYLIQTRFNVLYVCELKITQNEIKSSVTKEVQNKIEALKLPTGFSCIPILIHVGIVNNAVIDKNYFKSIIDFTGFIK